MLLEITCWHTSSGEEREYSLYPCAELNACHSRALKLKPKCLRPSSGWLQYKFDPIWLQYKFECVSLWDTSQTNILINSIKWIYLDISPNVFFPFTINMFYKRYLVIIKKAWLMMWLTVFVMTVKPHEHKHTIQHTWSSSHFRHKTMTCFAVNGCNRPSARYQYVNHINI